MIQSNGRIPQHNLLTFLVLFWSIAAVAQSKTTSVGLAYRPIFPLNFIGTGEETQIVDDVNFTTGLQHGFSGGMIIRRGFTDQLALEVGINYVKRNYTLSITDSSTIIEDQFRIIGYEIPVSILALIQLGEAVYMNASLGAGLDAAASSVRTAGAEFEQIAIKKHTVNPALNANVGWEYRTPSSGSIYLGATYHRPIAEIYSNSVLYRKNGNDVIARNQLSGSYLTVDLRYYFAAEKDPKKKKKTRE